MMKQRFFVAIELPQQVRDNLAQVCQYFINKELFLGRCTRPENIHLTLKFLGEVKSEMVPAIDAALKTISHKSMQVNLGSLDVLPTRKNIRILFAHVIGDRLSSLAKKIDDVLADTFEPEIRPFKSHATIARIKSIKDRRKFLHELDVTTVSSDVWHINSFVLKSSVLTPEGSLYNDIAQYELY